MTVEEFLIYRAYTLGIEITRGQAEQFRSYYEMLVEKNKVMNLTAITDFQDVVEKHFLDSLTLVKALDPNQVQTVIDVGTGAGFPGIPLKIVFPHLQVTLLDSLNKRILFLEDVIKNLHLENVHAVHGRAEDLAGKEEYRERFDLAVSRAVSSLPVLCEYCLPYVRQGGYFVAYKSGRLKEEAETAEHAVKVLGGHVKDITYFTLPDSDIERSLVTIEKVRKTPVQYPRKAGIPKKDPL